MEEDLWWQEQAEKRKAKKDSTAETGIETEADADTMDFEERDDEGLYFSPENGNVIFATKARVQTCGTGKSPLGWLLSGSKDKTGTWTEASEGTESKAYVCTTSARSYLGCVWATVLKRWTFAALSFSISAFL